MDEYFSREKLLTVPELATYLSVSQKTIYGWTESGYIPHIKVGRLVRFDLAKVQIWLSERSPVLVHPGKPKQVPKHPKQPRNSDVDKIWKECLKA
jgi:excisionase family DNA binding protein